MLPSLPPSRGPTPPSVSARRGKSRPKRTCRASQRKPAFPTWRCACILPRINEFTLEHLTGTPVAQNLAAAASDARDNIAASVAKELQPYADGDGVTYPEETQVLTARVP